MDNNAYICGECRAGFCAFGGEDCPARCPECGSEKLLPAGKCKVCDEILPISELEGDNCGLCPECRKAAVSFFRLYIGRFFTRAEIDYLNRVYDGRDLGEGAEGCGAA